MPTEKRALMLSMLSLLMCCTMLIGTTFAWFTDSASTGINTIQNQLDDVLRQNNQPNSSKIEERKEHSHV